MYSGLILLVALVKSSCSFLLRQTVFRTANKIEYHLKNEIYNHYQSLPLDFYKQHSTGDLTVRLSEDVSRIKMCLSLAVMFGLNAITFFLLLIPYMFTINVKLTLYIMLPIPFLAACIYYVSSILYQHSVKTQNKLSELTTFVQETFAGIKVIQAFAKEADFTKYFTQISRDYQAQTLQLAAINALAAPIAHGVTGLGTILIVFIGVQEVMQGNITIGNVVEFILYGQAMTWPIVSMGLVNNFVQRAAVSQKRIDVFLQEKNPITSTKQLKRPIQGIIAFQNVSFTYPESGIQALRSISFEVPTGSSLAIIGPLGSGKSTIANLLLRLYDADTGLITIDGIPIQDYDIASLRQQIGYISQDIFLFPDTIQNNITFGKEGATEADIVQATRYADLYTDIQQLPQKMDTMLGERGATLSGGQKQRVAIARALIREPRILILDDSFSAVDTKTENSILITLKKIMRSVTTLIISQRVSTVRLAHQILVLDAARVTEQGTHQSLIAARGLYYKLYQNQKAQQELAR